MNGLKRLVLGAALAASLAVAGCGTTGSSGSGGIDVSAVQNAAKAACNFLPTVTTVANIIASGNAIFSTAETVANAICAAVAPAKQAGKLSGALPTVNGVPVRGKFVR